MFSGTLPGPGEFSELAPLRSFSGLLRREGTGDLLECLVLGLWHEKDDEEDKQDEQHHKYQECVLLQIDLYSAHAAANHP